MRLLKDVTGTCHYTDGVSCLWALDATTGCHLAIASVGRSFNKTKVLLLHHFTGFTRPSLLLYDLAFDCVVDRVEALSFFLMVPGRRTYSPILNV